MFRFYIHVSLMCRGTKQVSHFQQLFTVRITISTINQLHTHFEIQNLTAQTFKNMKTKLGEKIHQCIKENHVDRAESIPVFYLVCPFEMLPFHTVQNFTNMLRSILQIGHTYLEAQSPSMDF